MKLFINKHLHLPITVPLRGKWKPEAARAHLWVPNLGSAGLVVTGSGSPEASALLTNWIKLHWWKTSCIPLWTPRFAGLGRNSRLIIPVLCVVWSWGERQQGWAEVGAQAGAGRGTGTASHAGSSSICCLQMTQIWQLSPPPCQEEMSCGSNHWRFSFWDSLSQLFFYFILSPRFQVQLQTQKCVSSLSAEKGFMCSADYCMSLFSTESKL